MSVNSAERKIYDLNEIHVLSIRKIIVFAIARS